MTCGVTAAKFYKANSVACASTGNTSASMSSYAAIAGLRSVIFIPEGKIAYGKLAQALAFGGKTLRQLDLRNKYHINVAAIRRESPATERRDFCVVPLPDEVVNAEDTLIVLGGDADLQRLPAS